MKRHQLETFLLVQRSTTEEFKRYDALTHGVNQADAVAYSAYVP